MSNASPCRSNSPATTCRRLSSSVTSSGTTSAEPPASLTNDRVCSLPSTSMSAIATCAPPSARASAVALPSPLAAPVTSATRPFSDPSIRTSVPIGRPQPGRWRPGPQFGHWWLPPDLARCLGAPEPRARGGPDVGERDRPPAPFGDQPEQVVVHRGDGRLVRVADDDPLRGEPLLGGADELGGTEQPGSAEGAVPHDHAGVAQIRRYAVHPLVVRAVGRPEERGVADPERAAQELLVPVDLLGDLCVRQRGEVGMGPGVVAGPPGRTPRAGTAPGRCPA